jgi:hypothetical protein
LSATQRRDRTPMSISPASMRCTCLSSMPASSVSFLLCPRALVAIHRSFSRQYGRGPLRAEYDSCTGPFGYLHLEGGLDAELTEKSCDVVHAATEDSGDRAPVARRRSQEQVLERLAVLPPIPSKVADIRWKGSLRSQTPPPPWPTTRRPDPSADRGTTA